MYSRILVAIDGGPTAMQALDEAVRIARRADASLRIVHVIDPMGHVSGYESCAAYTGYIVPHLREHGAALLASAYRRAVAAGVRCETQLCEVTRLSLAATLLDDVRTWQADLIVMGTHGRRGADRFFLGSEAETVARQAPVPVLLVGTGAVARTAAAASAIAPTESEVASGTEIIAG